MLVVYMSMLDDDEERDLLAKRYEEVRYSCLHTAERYLKDKTLAEDALHDAMLMVKGKSIDIRRKSKNMSDAIIEDFEDVLDDDNVNIEDTVLEEFDSEWVSDCLGLLDEVSRQIMRLKYIQEKSYKEIGDAMGMTIKTVEVRIARAKKIIRERVRKEVQNG